MLTPFLQSLRMLAVLTVVTGVAYPLLVTVIAAVAFPGPAGGSLLRDGDTVRGSVLLGQPFSGERYFRGRPSATAPTPYNAGASSGSNQGPTNPALAEAVAGRVKSLREAGHDPARPIPVDLVTASASGLDPHISPAGAEYQVARVARARGLAEDAVRQLVTRQTEGRAFGILGEPRVNVLQLNLALDRAARP
jgi:K+-transporting ATPase ATPase C chain